MKKGRRHLLGFDHPNIVHVTLPEVGEEMGFKTELRRGYSDWDVMHGRVKGEQFSATFELQQMPGCCAVLIASHIDPNPYNQETFNDTVKLIERTAHEAGFGSLMLSQVRKTHIEKEPWYLLLRRGYLLSKPFVNAKSGNEVSYITKDLKQEGKRNGLETPLFA